MPTMIPTLLEWGGRYWYWDRMGAMPTLLRGGGRYWDRVKRDAYSRRGVATTKIGSDTDHSKIFFAEEISGMELLLALARYSSASSCDGLRYATQPRACPINL